MKEKVTKIRCDYCEAEIEKSTPIVREMVELNDRQLDVEIRVFSSIKKRFTNDICRRCVFKAAAANADVIDAEVEQ